jgi:sugar phosphate permease
LGLRKRDLLGWRQSFYALAPLGIIAGVGWYLGARDRPAQHPRITRAEIDLIDAGRAEHPAAAMPDSWRAALVNRDVLLRAASCFCMNAVFYMFSLWLFTYLVEARGLSMLESGWLYVLPFATGSAFALAGGWICDFLCRRPGPLRGCRATAMPGLLIAAVFLLAGIYASNTYVAVAFLSLCFGFTLLADATYWAATAYAAGPHTLSAGGVLNFGGNIPGMLAPLVGFFIDRVGWVNTISGGSVVAVIGAGVWLLIRLRASEGLTR